MTPNSSNRLYVLDAIRGFAIVSIMLLHNLEHFDVYFLPENLPSWLVALDKMVWDTLFFLFAGKSYAMFALLFGVTFYIQSSNQEKRGMDFRGRFAWRLILLMGFGLINSAFYQGDILTNYAAIGVLVIPFAKANNKVIFAFALLLLLQPLEWWKLFTAWQNPDLVWPKPESWTYFGNMNEYIKDDSFWATVKGNLSNGKLAVLNWSYENGRFFHILSLFLFGLLAGRKQLFVTSKASTKFWLRSLIISSLVFIPLYIIQKNLGQMISRKAILMPLQTMETAWTNLAFMIVLISGFVMLFQKKFFHRILNIFSPIGQMSLSNYIFQSVLGSSLYYGFGLGLYQYTGATMSMLIGISLAILMGILCSWWAKHYQRGPLESIWHSLTWIKLKR
ncbi:MAG: DUF418 domain-containing protein [Marinifilum sp.]|jgi:uncharacterized protein|nr:DUF418 domain-containing protein [Marinifilum sp.]